MRKIYRMQLFLKEKNSRDKTPNPWYPISVFFAVYYSAIISYNKSWSKIKEGE